MSDTTNISNIQNEILTVGSIYKQPELLIEYGQYIKSKYDFDDEVTRFFYDNALIIYQKRTQTFNQSTINTFMTEDEDRLKNYKKYGGWKTVESWINLSLPEDFKNYYEILKKYSLLREYERNGFDISKIISHPKFNLFNAIDIYRLIRSKADKIHTVILTNNESEILNLGLNDIINDCLEKPDMGVILPYQILNELFRGLRTKNMLAIGMLSNAGKSRFMFKIIAFLALVLKQKVLVLLNEMSIEDMKYCLLTTVINNPEFQYLHGININKNEREITLGLYRNKRGDFIYRHKDSNGNFTETIDEYKQRLQQESEEYLKITNIATWIENETNGIIYAKDISSNYDDKMLEFEIRKANLVYGVKYTFYDTLKNPIETIGDWSALKATSTKLKELASQLDMFIYGSIQLTDDTNYIEPLELTSSNIASCKHIKHILDELVLFKEIDKQDYYKYCYFDTFNDWGEPIEKQLDLNKRYYSAVVDKNRAGEKKKIVFEVDLNKNTWMEIGEIYKK
jgi:replicative DNA helicase